MEVKSIIALVSSVLSVAASLVGYVPCQIDGMKVQEIQKEQEEEITPLMSGEEFDKIMSCLDEQVPEIWNEWADYIDDRSGGEARLLIRMAQEYVPEDVYRDYEETEYLGKYYLVYVGETWEDHSVNWDYFYVSDDFDEVLWYDKLENSEYPVLYLDEWRNSYYYRKLK